MGGKLASDWKLERGKTRIEEHCEGKPRPAIMTKCNHGVKNAHQDAVR
jgi:hypothetical protein